MACTVLGGMGAPIGRGRAVGVLAMVRSVLRPSGGAVLVKRIGSLRLRGAVRIFLDLGQRGSRACGVHLVVIRCARSILDKWAEPNRQVFRFLAGALDFVDRSRVLRNSVGGVAGRTFRRRRAGYARFGRGVLSGGPSQLVQSKSCRRGERL